MDEIDIILREIDTDGNCEISRSEWEEFLGLLIEHDVVYLRQQGLIDFRSYWGLVYDQDCDENHVGGADGSYISWYSRDCHFVSSGLLDKGWVEDYWYYQRNNHPIGGLFFHDKDHPLTIIPRLNIIFVCQSYGLLVTSILNRELASRWEYYAYVTLPMLALYNILLYIYQCPCVHVRHEITAVRKYGLLGLRWFGFLVGFLFFVMGCVLLRIGIPIALSGDKTLLEMWFASWMASYLLRFVLDILIAFNPFHVSVKIREYCLECLGFDAGFYINFASWQWDRRYVMERLHPGDSMMSSTGL